MFTYQGSECNTQAEAPATAPRQKQNHSFTATPGARLTNEVITRQHFWGNEHHFPPNLELL